MQTEKQLFVSPNNFNLGKQQYFEGDIILPEKRPLGGIKASAVYENQIWSTKKIPYVISDDYSMNIYLIVFQLI